MACALLSHVEHVTNAIVSSVAVVLLINNIRYYERVFDAIW